MGFDLANSAQFLAPRPDIGARPLPPAAKTGDSFKASAMEFESVFLSQLLKEMLAGETVKSSFGGGFGEDMFRELLADEYAKEIARSGGIGLADHVQREMLAMQEIHDE